MAAKRKNNGCKFGPAKEERLRHPGKASASCHYYQQGYCAKAAKCSFSHGSSSKILRAASKLNDSQATQMDRLKFLPYAIHKAPAVQMVPLLHQNLHNASFKPLQLNLLPVLEARVTDSSHTAQQKRKKGDNLSKFKHYIQLHEEQARKVSEKSAYVVPGLRTLEQAPSAVPDLRTLIGCKNIMLKDSSFAGPKSLAEIQAKKKQKSAAQFEAERNIDCEAVPKSFADNKLSDIELEDAAESSDYELDIDIYDDFLETILS